ALLLVGELQAGYRARDHVFLELDEVVVRARHTEYRVDLGAARNQDHNARPVVLIDTAPKTVLHGWGAGNSDLLRADRTEILHNAAQAALGGVHFRRERFSGGPLSDKQVGGVVRRAHGGDGAGQDSGS